MSGPDVSIAVTPEERRIISALRDLPPSPLKELLAQVMDRLVDYVREPACPEMQADGVPCASVDADCEQCRMLKDVLETLKERLAHQAHPPAQDAGGS